MEHPLEPMHGDSVSGANSNRDWHSLVPLIGTVPTSLLSTLSYKDNHC